MVKLILLVLVLSEAPVDWSPLSYLIPVDKQATCNAMMNRFIKCNPQLAQVLRQPRFRSQMVRSCMKETKRKSFLKAWRCLRKPTCKQFQKCIMR